MFWNCILSFWGQSLWIFVTASTWILILWLDWHCLVKCSCFLPHCKRRRPALWLHVFIFIGSWKFQGLQRYVASRRNFLPLIKPYLSALIDGESFFRLSIFVEYSVKSISRSTRGGCQVFSKIRLHSISDSHAFLFHWRRNVVNSVAALIIHKNTKR